MAWNEEKKCMVYNNIETINITTLHNNIAIDSTLSALSKTNFDGCTHHEASKELHILFNSEPSQADKDRLEILTP